MSRVLILLLFALSLASCPGEVADKKTAQEFQPSTPIPAEHPLLSYADLRLGMSNLDVSQIYNAPEGKGKGFTRTVEEYGDARNHVIQFDDVEGQPTRKIVLRVYQDKLAMIVDRRDGLSEQQAGEWFAELKKTYGEPLQETLGGAQWVWGEQGGITLTFTQDNASPENMSANVVIVHKPSYEASKRYLAQREKLK